jgi:ribA/ribD-fused uncharacterized protein
VITIQPDISGDREQDRMSNAIPRYAVVGATLQAVRHTPYYEPVFVVNGLGPASFRDHFLVLSTGIVVNLFVAEMTIVDLPAITTPGETTGIPVGELLGKRIVGVALDDVSSPIVVLEGNVYLKDDHDAFYSSPLVAAPIEEAYDAAARQVFVDHWTGKPFTPADIILFYRTGDQHGYLSNFAPYPIELRGRLWPTSEHYFQAQKFAGTEWEEAVRQASSPMTAAKMGRDRSLPMREDWPVTRDDVMREAVRAKFLQNAGIRDTLLETGSSILVERTSNDAYWGDGGDGRGKNMLGRILMEVRDSFRLPDGSAVGR